MYRLILVQKTAFDTSRSSRGRKTLTGLRSWRPPDWLDLNRHWVPGKRIEVSYAQSALYILRKGHID